MKIVVTGGAGYIGSHTVQVLVAAGHDVVSVDRRPMPDWLPATGARSEVVDIRDLAALDAAIEGFRPEAVMHFAAEKSAPRSVLDPFTAFDANVAGTTNVLEAMGRHGVRFMIFSSSCAVYGTPAASPVDEAAPLAPENPYGESKVLGERLLPWFERAHEIRFAALRYFNAAGAALDGSNGEDGTSAVSLIPTTIEAALGRRPPLEIYGRDYETPDGTAIRDYVHVVDLAEAHLAALEVRRRGSPSLTLNLGTGRGASVLDVVRAVGAAFGRSVPHVFAGRRPGDPAAVWADPRLAARALGWTARLDLDAIVGSALAWQRRP
ncbi:MAG TPA: UDP-glucose 4-epimerase GalE [Candidatus Binatus sp.]|nr:UDP-glucose 4-epimerase GalE [Candidatus Binatus sp.]